MTNKIYLMNFICDLFGNFLHLFMGEQRSYFNLKWLIVIYFLLAVACFIPRNPSIPLRRADADLLLRLRGPRFMSSELVFIYLSEDDIEALGGWPITRDYYSYLIHILTEKHAKVIGMDILMNTPNRQYPEYDRILADFLLSSNRVVLPQVLDFSIEDSVIRIESMPEFTQNAAAVGFSNLDEGSVQWSVPIIKTDDCLKFSFGLAMIQVYLHAEIKMEDHHVVLSDDKKHDICVPVDKKGRLFINPTGCISQFNTMGMTTLMKAYESQSDSLDFTNKIVLIAATAPSLPVIRSTPLCSKLPASLIHLTVAENILHKRWLRFPSFIFEAFWLMLWGTIGIVIRRMRWYWWSLLLLISVCLIIGISVIIIHQFNMVMPLYISTQLFFGISAIVRFMIYIKDNQIKHHRLKEIVGQIQNKENALIEAKKRLVEVEARLIRETADKKQLSETSRQLAREKETVVLELEKQVRDLKTSVQPGPKGQSRFPDIIHGSNSPMISILHLVQKVAQDNIPILVQGETGTGKELIARAIHRASVRHRKPFVAVNCGALSESLLESELFGHEKGAFTGAHSQRRGRFELAHGGTIFLDEITETTSGFQARLLRVLQDGTFERVGGERTLNADVRVIAAHNKNLQEEVKAGRFREDLFFRLSAFPINLPPLRDRKEDLPLLIDFFMHRYQKTGRMSLSDAVMEQLSQYRWPGNVRELENLIRRAVLLAESEYRKIIQLKDLPEDLQKTVLEEIPSMYHSIESQILETLRAFQFSHSAISQAARALGNRDRGTITEYFRGLCFQYFVEYQYDLSKAAANLTGSNDAEIIARVEGKMRGYVENVRQSVEESPEHPTCYKGLPKKFHPYLDKIIENIKGMHPPEGF